MNESERLDKAIEKILADQSPRDEIVHLTEDEQGMVRMAQLLRGSKSQGPSPEFEERLRVKVLARPDRVSRRTAVLSGLGALAAGIVGGFSLDRSTRSTPPQSEPALVGTNGQWIKVANFSDLAEGAIQPFTAGAVQGFLINRGGHIHALSRICTHMACTLNFHGDEQAFVCPCHGAEFDMRGNVLYGPHKYDQKLPPLPKIETRVNGQSVEVWSV